MTCSWTTRYGKSGEPINQLYATLFGLSTTDSPKAPEPDDNSHLRFTLIVCFVACMCSCTSKSDEIVREAVMMTKLRHHNVVKVSLRTHNLYLWRAFGYHRCSQLTCAQLCSASFLASGNPTPQPHKKRMFVFTVILGGGCAWTRYRITFQCSECVFMRHTCFYVRYRNVDYLVSRTAFSKPNWSCDLCKEA